ncbi:hypothetical protein ACJMK2_024938 [Sinanodonta woodiana]|uniref:Uncharacterized protein n=1 Tax=Sinanodonta woodiana TaxID=1069815 RepID=A0ABD3XF08_SINWO
MDIVTKLWIAFMFFVTCHTKDWKHDIYMKGENATISIDQQTSSGKVMLEITFSSYTSKLDAIRVILYFPKDKQDVCTGTYIGRVHDIKANNYSFSFILQHVDFVDSGHYTAREDARELGKASVIVPRRTLLGDYNNIMLISFICNSVNISKIQIDMITSTRTIFVVMYDVRNGECTESGQHYLYRIQHCVFTGNTFSFTIRDVSWLDKGVYAAWDSTDILLDSVLLDVRERNEISSTEHSSGYFNSSCVNNPACSEAQNELWVRLLFAAVGVAVTVPLTVACTLLIQRSQRSFRYTYKEAGILAVHTEDNNPSGSCIKEYEKLRPDGNQVNSSYSSLGAENIQVSKRPIILFR